MTERARERAMMQSAAVSSRRFANFDVKYAGQVARIRILRASSAPAGSPREDIHWELLEIVSAIRIDNSVRIVVIEGAEDGEFHVPTPMPVSTDDAVGEMEIDSAEIWKASTGVVRLHEAMAELDRPIIAKVNGDAIGFASSIVFACDLIVARCDARIADNHLGMGEVGPFVVAQGVVPGDGGVALLPLFMSPVKAKEYLMLAKEYTGSELAALGAINYAVSADALDETVESMVQALLRRPAYALAWTKRIANKHVVDQLHRTLDAGVAYELVNMYQLAITGTDPGSLE